MLLRTATWDGGLDFLTVIIPAISPGDILDDAAGLCFACAWRQQAVRQRMSRGLYASLDPTGLPAAPVRVAHLGPVRAPRPHRRGAAHLDWAAAWGVTRLHAYPRGHALALFAPSMYGDYARVLDEDLRAPRSLIAHPRSFCTDGYARAHDVRRARPTPGERRSFTHGTLSQIVPVVTKTVTIAGSIILATAIGVGLFLRPRSTAREQLAAPASIPAIARQALRTKMARHEDQMRTLVSRVVMLDDDGIARAAGEIFDEPSLARPVAGDELNGLLPERFFALQDELKAGSRRLVAASLSKNHVAMADEFAALAKSCVNCHDVYLHGDAPAPEGHR